MGDPSFALHTQQTYTPCILNECKGAEWQRLELVTHLLNTCVCVCAIYSFAGICDYFPAQPKHSQYKGTRLRVIAFVNSSLCSHTFYICICVCNFVHKAHTVICISIRVAQNPWAGWEACHITMAHRCSCGIFDVAFILVVIVNIVFSFKYLSISLCLNPFSCFVFRA